MLKKIFGLMIATMFLLSACSQERIEGEVLAKTEQHVPLQTTLLNAGNGVLIPTTSGGYSTYYLRVKTSEGVRTVVVTADVFYDINEGDTYSNMTKGDDEIDGE